MNGKFAKNVAFDVMVLWPLIYVAASDYAGFGIYAERFISFLGVLLLISGFVLVFAHKRVSEADGSIEKLKCTKPHLAYMAVTSVIEISVFAALGWYWVAGGFVAMAIGMMMLRKEIEKLEDA